MSNQFLVPRFKCGSSVNIAEQVRESERYSLKLSSEKKFQSIMVSNFTGSERKSWLDAPVAFRTLLLMMCQKEGQSPII
jgi:hypothetical protein